MKDILISAYKLINIYNSKSRSAHRYGCGEVLYPAQAHMIETIGTNEGITLTAAAALLFITRAAASQCIKQLCNADLVRRGDKGGVGGAQELYLTEKGKSVFDEHRRRHEDMINALEETWDSLSEEGRESIRKMLSVTEKHILEMEE